MQNAKRPELNIQEYISLISTIQYSRKIIDTLSLYDRKVLKEQEEIKRNCIIKKG